MHRSAERPTKLFVITAVVSMVLGGIAALLVALTRWEAVGLLSAPAFYKWLSIHAWSLLIFWMVFMEIGILYVGEPMVLGRRLPTPSLARVGWGLMAGSAGLILYSIWISPPKLPAAADLLRPPQAVVWRGNPTRGRAPE